MLKNETIRTNILPVNSDFYTVAKDFQIYFNSETQKTELKKCDSEVGDSLYFPIGKGVRYGIKSTKEFDIVISDKSPGEFRPNEIRTPNDECDYVKVPDNVTLDGESYAYSFNTQTADKYCLIYFKGETMDESVEIDEIANLNLDKQNELTKVEKGIYSVAKREEISSKSFNRYRKSYNFLYKPNRRCKRRNVCCNRRSKLRSRI